MTARERPPSRGPPPARIISASSKTHFDGELVLDDLDLEHGYSGYQAYTNSKLVLVLFTPSLAERLEGTGVTANCFHPGVIATKLLRASTRSATGASPDEGAPTPVYLLIAPELEHVTGRYFSGGREAAVSIQARDGTLREQLWRLSELIAGLEPADPGEQPLTHDAMKIDPL